MILGIAIILIGLVFLLQNLGYLSSGVWEIVWPSLLILIGVSMIMKKSGCCHCGHDHKEK